MRWLLGILARYAASSVEVYTRSSRSRKGVNSQVQSHVGLIDELHRQAQASEDLIRAAANPVAPLDFIADFSTSAYSLSERTTTCDI